MMVDVIVCECNQFHLIIIYKLMYGQMHFISFHYIHFVIIHIKVIKTIMYLSYT